MASSKEVQHFTEWERVEEGDDSDEEESGIERTELGEEAGRGLTRNEQAWKSCDKLNTDADYHQRYIPLNDALGFRYLSSEDQKKFIKDKSLTDEDRMFLSSEQAVKCLERFSNAAVCITVKLSVTTKAYEAYGTGFLVRVNNEDVVITNSHSIRSSESGDGIDFRLVEPANVKVIFFYDGKGSSKLTRKVSRIESASPPAKNEGQNVLIESMQRQLRGQEKSGNAADIGKCNIALGLLDSYFSRRDAFLDYGLLYLEPLEKAEQKAKFTKVEALTMKAFDKLDHFRNVSSIESIDPSSSKYPRSLRLFAISHPHRASKQVSFGGMLSNLTHVFFLNMAYGQNDTGMLNGKEPFAEHSITTCRGSSGSPIFVYIVNHETNEVLVEEFVYFLHFYGDAVDGEFRGKSVSFSTIIKNLQRQADHAKLAAALADVAGNTPELEEGEEH